MTTEFVQRRRFGGSASESTDATSIDNASVVSGETPTVFEGWRSAATSLTVWHRNPPADVEGLLDELKLDRISGWRGKLDVTRAQSIISEAMAECGFCTQGLVHFLATDMALLTRVFALSTGASRVEACLEIIRDDACRRFHVDSYPARLAVTYVGPGTVWVPSSYGKKALIEQDDYTGPAIEIPTYSAGMFAGEAAGREGLVHRSPRIAGTGRMRLFFCVNAARH